MKIKLKSFLTQIFTNQKMKIDTENTCTHFKDKKNKPEPSKLYQKKLQNEKKLHMIVIVHKLDV